MPTFTVAKIRSQFADRTDEISEAILLLTDGFAEEVGISSRKDSVGLLKTLMNLRGFNMIMVGEINEPVNTDAWKNVLEVCVEVYFRNSRKPPTLKRLVITPNGILVQWDTSPSNLKKLCSQFNELDSFGDTKLYSIVAPIL